MAQQIILGLLFPLLGGGIMYISPRLLETFGRIDWAERNVGGTRNAYLLIGIVLVILGVLILFGVVSVNSPVQELPTITSVS